VQLVKGEDADVGEGLVGEWFGRAEALAEVAVVVVHFVLVLAIPG
jgi:hypothetical protein